MAVGIVPLTMDPDRTKLGFDCSWGLLKEEVKNKKERKMCEGKSQPSISRNPCVQYTENAL